MTTTRADAGTGAGTGVRTAADALVAILEVAGVPVVFGLPGVHNLAAWKALSTSSVRLVTVRHEQTAAYAADGWARASGQVGVALTTTGPGAANTLGAVGEAWASRSPVVVVATDIATGLRRPGVYRGALHEVGDQAGMFAPVTKEVIRVGRAAEVAGAMARAVVVADAAPKRPVYLEIPTDVLGAAEVQGLTDLAADQVAGAAAGTADESAVARAAALLDRAERPLVWAGGGALQSGAGAAAAVARLAEHLGAPVLTTYSARGLLGASHPCAVGLPPHVPEAGALWDEADVVVAIGSDLDGMMTQNWRMPAPPSLVVVNVDPADATKNYSAAVVIDADATAGTEALAAAVADRGGTVLAALESRLGALRSSVAQRLEAEEPEAAAFLRSFATAVPGDTVVVADMCIAGYWLAGFHQVAGPRRLAYPMGWGTLGFAFPAALGAAIGLDTASGRRSGASKVVSVSGDGGFLFACGDLATMAQERAPLTAVIVDDGGYGMLRYDQQRAGEAPFGMDLVTPDFVALARAFGIRADAVKGLGTEFADALASHLADPAPSVLVASARLDPPPTTSPRWYRSV